MKDFIFEILFSNSYLLLQILSARSTRHFIQAAFIYHYSKLPFDTSHVKYKRLQLRLPAKVIRWLSDFLVGKVIQVKVDGFLLSKIYPKAGVLQGSVLSPLIFLIYVNDMPGPKHHLYFKSQFADDTGLWATSKKGSLAANRLQRDLGALAEWCAKWRLKLNPE